MFKSLPAGWEQQVFERADFGVLLKADNHYWLNPYLCSALMLKEPVQPTGEWVENDPLDNLLLKSGRTFQLPGGQDEQVWLKREHIQAIESDVYLFHNCSDLVVIGNECRRLQGELSKAEDSGSVHGLINNDVIMQLLDGHISRSRRYLNPLSLLRISYKFSAEMEPQLVSRCIQRIAFFLKDQLRWADQVGMLNEHTFLIILPETNYESAASLLKKFNAEPHLSLFSSGEGRPLSFSIGLVEWKKGDVATKMLNHIQQNVDLTVV